MKLCTLCPTAPKSGIVLDATSAEKAPAMFPASTVTVMLQMPSLESQARARQSMYACRATYRYGLLQLWQILLFCCRVSTTVRVSAGVCFAAHCCCSGGSYNHVGAAHLCQCMLSLHLHDRHSIAHARMTTSSRKSFCCSAPPTPIRHQEEAAPPR